MINTTKKYINIYVNLLYYMQRPYMFRPPVLAIFREVFVEGFFKGYIPYVYVIFKNSFKDMLHR